MTFLRFVSLVVLSCLLLAGCGTALPLEGTVTVDGAPLATGNIAFHPAGTKGENDAVVGRSNIDSAGKYKLMTNGQPGIAPGSYKVVVIASAPSDPNNQYSLPVSLVNQKFTQLETTPLTVEVASGASPETYNLTVTK